MPEARAGPPPYVGGYEATAKSYLHCRLLYLQKNRLCHEFSASNPLDWRKCKSSGHSNSSAQAASFPLQLPDLFPRWPKTASMPKIALIGHSKRSRAQACPKSNIKIG